MWTYMLPRPSLPMFLPNKQQLHNMESRDSSDASAGCIAPRSRSQEGTQVVVQAGHVHGATIHTNRAMFMWLLTHSLGGPVDLLHNGHCRSEASRSNRRARGICLPAIISKHLVGVLRIRRSELRHVRLKLKGGMTT